MLSPRNTDRNKFVHDFLAFQKGLEASLNKEGNSRLRKAAPEVPQERHKDGEIAQIPVLDHEDARGWFGSILHRR